MADSENELVESENTEQATPKTDVTDETLTTSQSNEEENQNEDNDPDPIELFKEVFKKTQLEELKREAIEQAKREYAAEQAAQQQEQAAQLIQQRLNESFEQSVKEARAAALALKVYDEDGNPLQLSDDDFQKIVGPWNGHNAKVNELTTQKVYADVAGVVHDLLPAEVKAEFVKRANQKPLNEYFQIFADLMAEQTPTVKKLKQEHEVAVSAAQAAGFAKGQKAPKGTPKQENERTVESKEKHDTTSLVGAARALAAGQISNEEYLKIFNNYGRG